MSLVLVQLPGIGFKVETAAAVLDLDDQTTARVSLLVRETDFDLSILKIRESFGSLTVVLTKALRCLLEARIQT